MAAKPDYKKYGFIPQRQKGLLLMRLRNCAGNASAEDLRKIAALAEKFGSGEVHFTVRQGVEIPGVPEERFEEALQAILDAGLQHAVCGLRVRPVMVCPGNSTCPYGLVDTNSLGKLLDKDYVGKDLPAKTKFTVCGCANACTTPQGHDVGFRGAAEPLLKKESCVRCGACVKRCPAKAMSLEAGELVIDYQKCLSCGVCVRLCPKKALQTGREGYHIYVGGKGGRYTQEGKIVAEFIAEKEVPKYLDAILAVYEDIGEKGQRLNAVMSRYGLRNFQKRMEKKLGDQ